MNALERVYRNEQSLQTTTLAKERSLKEHYEGYANIIQSFKDNPSENLEKILLRGFANPEFVKSQEKIKAQEIAALADPSLSPQEFAVQNFIARTKLMQFMEQIQNDLRIAIEEAENIHHNLQLSMTELFYTKLSLQNELDSIVEEDIEGLEQYNKAPWLYAWNGATKPPITEFLKPLSDRKLPENRNFKDMPKISELVDNPADPFGAKIWREREPKTYLEYVGSANHLAFLAEKYVWGESAETASNVLDDRLIWEDTSPAYFLKKPGPADSSIADRNTERRKEDLQERFKDLKAGVAKNIYVKGDEIFEWNNRISDIQTAISQNDVDAAWILIQNAESANETLIFVTEKKEVDFGLLRNIKKQMNQASADVTDDDTVDFESVKKFKILWNQADTDVDNANFPAVDEALQTMGGLVQEVKTNHDARALRRKIAEYMGKVKDAEVSLRQSAIGIKDVDVKDGEALKRGLDYVNRASNVIRSATEKEDFEHADFFIDIVHNNANSIQAGAPEREARQIKEELDKQEQQKEMEQQEAILRSFYKDVQKLEGDAQNRGGYMYRNNLTGPLIEESETLISLAVNTRANINSVLGNRNYLRWKTVIPNFESGIKELRAMNDQQESDLQDIKNYEVPQEESGQSVKRVAENLNEAHRVLIDVGNEFEYVSNALAGMSLNIEQGSIVGERYGERFDPKNNPYLLDGKPVKWEDSSTIHIDNQTRERFLLNGIVQTFQKEYLEMHNFFALWQTDPAVKVSMIELESLRQEIEQGLSLQQDQQFKVDPHKLNIRIKNLMETYKEQKVYIEKEIVEPGKEFLTKLNPKLEYCVKGSYTTWYNDFGQMQIRELNGDFFSREKEAEIRENCFQTAFAPAMYSATKEVLKGGVAEASGGHFSAALSSLLHPTMRPGKHRLYAEGFYGHLGAGVVNQAFGLAGPAFGLAGPAFGASLATVELATARIVSKRCREETLKDPSTSEEEMMACNLILLYSNLICSSSEDDASCQLNDMPVAKVDLAEFYFNTAARLKKVAPESIPVFKDMVRVVVGLTTSKSPERLEELQNKVDAGETLTADEERERGGLIQVMSDALSVLNGSTQVLGELAKDVAPDLIFGTRGTSKLRTHWDHIEKTVTDSISNMDPMPEMTDDEWNRFNNNEDGFGPERYLFKAGKYAGDHSPVGYLANVGMYLAKHSLDVVTRYDLVMDTLSGIVNPPSIPLNPLTLARTGPAMANVAGVVGRAGTFRGATLTETAGSYMLTTLFGPAAGLTTDEAIALTQESAFNISPQKGPLKRFV